MDSQSGILSFFPGIPREGQADALKEIERNKDRYDVFLLVVPTGGGKTKIAVTLLRYFTALRGGAGYRQAWYGHPNNVLLDQVLTSNDAKGIATIRVQEWYKCKAHDITCQDRRQSCGGFCKPRPGRNWWTDPKACPYVKDLRGLRAARHLTTTWHMRMAHKLMPPVAIIDEAHLSEHYAAELDEKVIWPHRYGRKTPIRTAVEAVEWLRAMGGPGKDAPLNALATVLDGRDDCRVFTSTVRDYFGKPKNCLVMSPIRFDTSKSFPWFGAEKIVLMSGTLSDTDVRRMGLARHGRVLRIDVPSPIPPENRPVRFYPVADMTLAKRKESVPIMAKWLAEELLPAHAGERGLIHATYDVARALRELAVSSPTAARRLLFHSKADKAAVISSWMATPADDRVLVASGVEEGLDLAGALGRFQVITSVPRGSLEDPVNVWLTENDPEAYTWATIRKLVQASGRICRGPKDFGLTLITDSSFGRIELARSLQDFPEYWRDALILPDD